MIMVEEGIRAWVVGTERRDGTPAPPGYPLPPDRGRGDRVGLWQRKTRQVLACRVLFSGSGREVVAVVFQEQRSAFFVVDAQSLLEFLDFLLLAFDYFVLLSDFLAGFSEFDDVLGVSGFFFHPFEDVADHCDTA